MNHRHYADPRADDWPDPKPVCDYCGSGTFVETETATWTEDGKHPVIHICEECQTRRENRCQNCGEWDTEIRYGVRICDRCLPEYASQRLEAWLTPPRHSLQGRKFEAERCRDGYRVTLIIAGVFSVCARGYGATLPEANLDALAEWEREEKLAKGDAA